MSIVEDEIEDEQESSDLGDELDEEVDSEEDDEEAMPKSKKTQWVTLSHSGVSFPEPYKPDPRTGTITIKDQRIAMTPQQEETAVAWARKIGGGGFPVGVERGRRVG